MRRLERLLAIALFLGARRRVRASDVADEFAISLRTVYRDMGALVEAGFPILGSAGDGYHLSQESFLRPLAFDAQDAEALAVAARALAASVDGPLRDALTRANVKLLATMTPELKRRVSQLDKRIRTTKTSRVHAPTAPMLEYWTLSKESEDGGRWRTRLSAF